MFEKQIMFGNDARKPILNGAEKVAKAVISTLGPLGRNVAIRRKAQSPPLITKDGVSVAREIKALPDYFEDIGLQMIKEAASRTNDIAGDGTTTATLLSYEMMKEGLDHIVKGSNAIHIRRGMQKACEAVCARLEEIKVVVDSPEQFKSIATISSQDEEIGALVSLVVQEVGNDGAVTVESGQALGISYDLTEGMQISSGFVSPHFANKKDKMMSVMEKPYVLISDERITAIEQILPTVELVHKTGRSLVIIAESVEHEALSTIIVNLPWVKVQGQNPGDKANFESLAIRAPEIGERRIDVLEDIACKVGGRVISKKVGLSLKSVVLQDLGMADQIISTQYVTTIVNGAGSQESVDNRCAMIKSALASAEGDEKDFLKGRLANITGRIAVIRVGASSEVEQKEKQHRVEDAIAAVRAAADEGIVPGGGTAFLEARPVIGDLDLKTDGEKIGAGIVLKTLEKPLWWIATNAGYDGDEIIKKVMEMNNGEGFNAETGEYVDMMKENIIDPKKVSRCALENAVSVAGSFLTLEVAITDLPGASQA